MFLTQVVDKMRLMFLHKVLNRHTEHWTKKMLTHLKTQDLGWAKNIQTKLNNYGIELDWDTIKQKTKGEWKRIVTDAVNKFNQEKLLKNCTATTTNGIKINTKTANIHKELQSPEYQRQPITEITKADKQKTRIIILARHGMLECGANFKGTMSEMCKHCNLKDNENHRLNECINLKETNWATSNDKIDFSTIYSNDSVTVGRIIERIECIWEFRYANGRMKK